MIVKVVTCDGCGYERKFKPGEAMTDERAPLLVHDCTIGDMTFHLCRPECAADAITKVAPHVGRRPAR